jgi:uncharacterized membrane protein YczE
VVTGFDLDRFPELEFGVGIPTLTISFSLFHGLSPPAKSLIESIKHTSFLTVGSSQIHLSYMLIIVNGAEFASDLRVLCKVPSARHSLTCNKS